MIWNSRVVVLQVVPPQRAIPWTVTRWPTRTATPSTSSSATSQSVLTGAAHGFGAQVVALPW